LTNSDDGLIRISSADRLKRYASAVSYDGVMPPVSENGIAIKEWYVPTTDDGGVIKLRFQTLGKGHGYSGHGGQGQLYLKHCPSREPASGVSLGLAVEDAVQVFKRMQSVASIISSILSYTFRFTFPSFGVLPTYVFY
jgi:hypothetical protein